MSTHDNEQNITLSVPPGATVYYVHATAEAEVTKAQPTEE